VIHKVTDHQTTSPHANGTPAGAAMKCPITGAVAGGEVEELNINVDEIGDVPSLKEYKKLKKVMAMITKFYRDGSERKRQNYEDMTKELEKLEADEKMVQAQLRALETKPSFTAHPKQKEYRRDLQAEMDALLKQKETFLAKQKDFQQLYEWSKTIVKVCEWLELTLDDYCSKQLPDFPQRLKAQIRPVPELTPEQAKEYFKGLDEITYNLQESQDFFQASVDGRLNKYHNIERQIIEAQLEALSQFPADSPRRLYIEGELQRDLEYVKGNMEENPEGIRRRQKMLKNHQEFFKVLRYHMDKLKLAGLIPQDTSERVYDPRFNHYQD
jgi:hypothetical protein